MLDRDATPEGGESPEAFHDRILQGCATISGPAAQEAPPLIVAHSGTIRSVMAALDLPFLRRRIARGLQSFAIRADAGAPTRPWSCPTPFPKLRGCHDPYPDADHRFVRHCLCCTGPDLTIYTSQPQEQMTEVIAAFNKDHPDISIDIFRSGTTEVMAKLQAEFAAGQSPADVLLIADAVAMTQLKQDDRLMAYPEAPVEGIDPALLDADATFFPTS